MNNDTIIKAVSKYALDHYNEDGWDFIVETYGKEEFATVLSGDNLSGVPITTVEQAIKEFGAIARLLNERRQSVLNEIF